jgi:hypothetical protein
MSKKRNRQKSSPATDIRVPEFDTGGKPSTWFSPGRLTEQFFVTRMSGI